MNIIIKTALKFILPMCIDLIIKISKDLADKSDNTIDNRFVEVLEENKIVIIGALGTI